MTIGLIAGHGSFPRLILRAARRAGHDVAVVAVEREASPELEADAHAAGARSFRWVQLGQLNDCITALRSAGASQAVMAGHVRHVRIFDDVSPDALLLPVLQALPSQNADALLAAVAHVLQAHGITLMDSTALLPELLAREGVLTRKSPTDAMRADFAFGYRIADAIAGLDVGQTVVVKDRAAVAIEGMDGTDATIRRAGTIAGPGTRVVKVAKPAQDRRFDVPVVGLGTIDVMKAAGADGLSVDAGLTLLLDGDDFIAAADDAGLVVVGRGKRR